MTELALARAQMAMLNPASATETIHMVLAAFAASGFAVAGIHAFLLLKDREIALVVGGAAAVLQPLSGDMNGRFVAGAVLLFPAIFLLLRVFKWEAIAGTPRRP